MFVVVVASRRGFVIVLSLCEDKTSFPPPLFSLWIWRVARCVFGLQRPPPSAAQGIFDCNGILE